MGDQRESSPTSTLRVAILLGGLDVGGAETQAIVLAAEMQRQGHCIEVIALADGPLRPIAEAHGLVLHIVPRVFALAVTAVPRLTQILSVSRVQVLYAFLEVQWILALAAVSWLPKTKRPRVVLGLRSSSYGDRPAALKARLVQKIAKHASRRANLLIANSHSGLDSYRAVVSAAPAGVVISNGVDAKRFLPSVSARARWRKEWSIPQDATIVGHVGRLAPIKDHEMLITAFSLAFAKDATCHLVCVGHGTTGRIADLVRLAESLGISSRVHIVGSQEDTSTIYPSFDVLALTSRREGFPSVVAEAMCCGVPAVVTDCGASAEIVSSFGELAPIGATQDFADALSRMMIRRSPLLAQESRTHVASNYSLDAAARRTASELQALLAGTKL